MLHPKFFNALGDPMPSFGLSLKTQFSCRLINEALLMAPRARQGWSWLSTIGWCVWVPETSLHSRSTPNLAAKNKFSNLFFNFFKSFADNEAVVASQILVYLHMSKASLFDQRADLRRMIIPNLQIKPPARFQKMPRLRNNLSIGGQPVSPAKQLARVAGLPKPTKCL